MIDHAGNMSLMMYCIIEFYLSEGLACIARSNRGEKQRRCLAKLDLFCEVICMGGRSYSSNQCHNDDNIPNSLVLE